MDTIPSELLDLAHHTEHKPHSFVLGDADIQHAAIRATKFLFDKAVSSESSAASHINSLLAEIRPSGGPATRSSKKRKRSPTPELPLFATTPLDALFVDGMTPDQVWEQLELRAKNVCAILDAVIERDGDFDDELPGEDHIMNDINDDEGIEDEDDSDYQGSSSDEGMYANEELSGEEGQESEGSEVDLGEDIAPLRDADAEEEDAEQDEEGSRGVYDLDLDRPRRIARTVSRRPRHPTLDDDFFSIDEFNRQTEEMEAKSHSRGGLADDDDDEDDDDVDLFAAVSDGEGSEKEGDFEDEDSEPKELYYKDFFAPPPRSPKRKAKGKERQTEMGSSPPKLMEGPEKHKNRSVRFSESVRVKNIKAVGKRKRFDMSFLDDLVDDDDDDDDEDDDEGGFQLLEDMSDDSEADNDAEHQDDGEEGSEASDVDGLETIERLKEDLFAEEDEDVEQANLSNHEKRMKALSEQIAALEEENVAQKHWTLVGEASARGRPDNSLLEEDLEFEHLGKQIPIITEEVMKSLEDCIKARILENAFDDVVRRRPADDKPFLPSRTFELQDSKSQKSLAQIYEDEYTATKTGDSSVLDDRNGKLAKEHQTIEKQWNEICYKLDALCNAHFTPKQPKAVITTISNVASTTMESALPVVVSTSTLLAPEEVFAHDRKATRSKTELTPSEKRAARTREKRFKKKQRQALDAAVDKFARKGGAKGPKSVKEAKGMALKSLVKTGKGVTVVGKPSQQTGLKPGRGSGTEKVKEGKRYKL